jgi:hypothetical protein
MVENGATAKLCTTSIVIAQISDAFKITITSERLWEESTDQTVFAH